MDEITIRNGQAGDYAGIAEIYNHYVRTSTVIFSDRELTAEDFAEKLRPVIDGGFPFLVIEKGAGLMGYAYAHSYHPDPVYAGTWELTAYLSHRATGRGLGTRLISELIEHCRRGGAHVLISCITAGNEPCERMHRRLGFTLSGVLSQVGRKFDQWLDDALYTLRLKKDTMK